MGRSFIARPKNQNALQRNSFGSPSICPERSDNASNLPDDLFFPTPPEREPYEPSHHDNDGFRWIKSDGRSKGTPSQPFTIHGEQFERESEKSSFLVKLEGAALEVKTFRSRHERWIRLSQMSFICPGFMDIDPILDPEANSRFAQWEDLLKEGTIPYPQTLFSEIRLSYRFVLAQVRHLRAQGKKTNKSPELAQIRVLLGHEHDPDNGGLQGFFMNRIDCLLEIIQKSQSQIDFLTGVPNRRFLHDYLPLRRQRGDHLCLLAIDLDRFKAINDTFGHLVGDSVLREVAKVLRTNIRTEEKGLVFRIGGEEFLVLANTGLSGGMRLAERLRSSVEKRFSKDCLLDSETFPNLRVTVSVGVAQCRGGTGSLAAINAARQEADKALYQAKAKGRNRVETGHSP